MKVPAHLPPCDNCEKSATVWIEAGDSDFNYSCECGEDLSGFFGNDVTIGYQILWRSSHEWVVNVDFDLAVVFAATAVECQLVDYHHLWRKIDGLKKGVLHTDEELGAMLRQYRSILEKVENISRVVFPEGFQKFLIASRELTNIINDFGFTPENILANIQQHLFWPRNEVLHSGREKCTQQQATRAFNIAILSLSVFRTLHEHVMTTL